MARGTTMRSRVNPLGVGYGFVQDGNLTISRTVLVWGYVENLVSIKGSLDVGFKGKCFLF